MLRHPHQELNSFGKCCQASSRYREFLRPLFARARGNCTPWSGSFTSWCGGHQLDPVNCPIGTVLEFLQARSSAGLTHSTPKVYVVIGLPQPSWWSVSGQTPPCYTFPPEAEASGQRAYAMWWIRMLFHSLESSDLRSSWGSRLTSQKLAFGTQAPPTLATLGPFSLALAVLHPHWAGILKVWWCGNLVPNAFQCSSSSWRGMSQVTHVTMVSRRERDAASRGHTSGIPASTCFTPRSWRWFHRTSF